MTQIVCLWRANDLNAQTSQRDVGVLEAFFHPCFRTLMTLVLWQIFVYWKLVNGQELLINNPINIDVVYCMLVIQHPPIFFCSSFTVSYMTYSSSIYVIKTFGNTVPTYLWSQKRDLCLIYELACRCSDPLSPLSFCLSLQTAAR